MPSRIVTMAEIAAHPDHSLAPSDYIFSAGDIVYLRDGGEQRIIVSQDGNDLRLAAVELVPGSTTPFVCHLLSGSASLYEVTRRRPGSRRASENR